jgi:hypothetical protein
MLFTKSHGYLYLILNAYLIGCYSGDNMLGILAYCREELISLLGFYAVLIFDYLSLAFFVQKLKQNSMC